MQINKFIKKKNGMYNVLLEDGTNLIAHEELILKYGLLLSKKIDKDLKEKIEEENLVYISYDLAIKYISKKVRSEKEIREYLAKNEIDKQIIDDTINLVKKDGYINDSTYCEMFINDKMLLSNDGPLKIKDELLKKGIEEYTINKKITIFNDELQKEKIKKIIDKQVKTNRNKSNYVLKNKILTYLSNLGYEKKNIMLILSNTNLKSDSEIFKKEYDKLYKKLSRKYSGDELEYKIKSKMYAKGFNVNRNETKY